MTAVPSPEDTVEPSCLNCAETGDPDARRVHPAASCPWRHSTPPPVSGTAPTNDELAERAKSLDAHTVVRNWLARHVGHPPLGGFDTRDEWLNWAASNFLADPEIAQHLTPVSETATRDDVARWLERTYGQAAEIVGDTPVWTADADELLALGGSQPATQPVQPAEEQRPIDLLTEQGDDGLRARVEALVADLQSEADERADLNWLLGVGERSGLLMAVTRLRRALDGNGGDRG